MRPAATPPASAVGHPAPELSLTVRRALVFVALAGYPLFVAAWLVLRDVLPGIAWAAVVAILGLAVLLSAYALYAFRRSMAQAPDDQLDERQVRVRDRAYLDSYRVFSALTLLGLLLFGILPDVLDRPLEVTYETVQPLLWGALLYSLVLPSAFVAWAEPELPVEG